MPGTCLILIAYPQVCASPGSSLGNSCFCVDRGRISAPLFQGNILGPADITAQGIALDLQGTVSHLAIRRVCIDSGCPSPAGTYAVLPSQCLRLDDGVFQELHHIGLQLRGIFQPVHMVSVPVVFRAGSVTEPVVDMEQVPTVIETVDLTAVFIVRKFCTVVSICQRQAVPFCGTSVFRDLFDTVRLCAIVAVSHRITVDIGNGGDHIVAIIGIIHGFPVNVDDLHQVPVCIAEKLLFPRGPCDFMEVSRIPRTVCGVGKGGFSPRSVRNGHDPAAGPGDRQGIPVLIADLYQISVAEFQLVLLLVMDHKLFGSIRMDGQCQLQPGFILPLLLFRVIIKIMYRAVPVCVAVIFCSRNIYFLQCLVIAEAEAIPVSQVGLAVVGIVHMVQGHWHTASSCTQGIMHKDQVAVVVIYMYRTRAAHVLAVVGPVIFQSGIIHIGDIDSGAHIFISAVTVGGKEFRIAGQFHLVFEHQSVIAPVLVPVFHHTGNIQSHISLLLPGIPAQVFHCLRIEWFIIPVNRIRIPCLEDFMHFNRTLLPVLRKGDQHQPGVDHHISRLDLREFKTDKTPLHLIAAHGL